MSLVAFFTHGKLLSADLAMYGEEPYRQLSPEGQARTRAASRGIATLGLDIGVIATSPYGYCVECAHILQGELVERRSIIDVPELDPDSSTAAATAAVEKLCATGEVGDACVVCIVHRSNADRLIAAWMNATAPVTGLWFDGLTVVRTTPRLGSIIIGHYDGDLLARLGRSHPLPGAD